MLCFIYDWLSPIILRGKVSLIFQKLLGSIRQIRSETLTLLTHILILVPRSVKLQIIHIYCTPHFIPKNCSCAWFLCWNIVPPPKQFDYKLYELSFKGCDCYDGTVLDVPVISRLATATRCASAHDSAMDPVLIMFVGELSVCVFVCRSPFNHHQGLCNAPSYKVCLRSRYSFYHWKGQKNPL